jgi:hypothetical protein
MLIVESTHLKTELIMTIEIFVMAMNILYIMNLQWKLTR